jgi:hypothetical protein
VKKLANLSAEEVLIDPTPLWLDAPNDHNTSDSPTYFRSA